MRALLEERRGALDQIEQAIAQLEKRKAPFPPNWTPDAPFSSFKGSLPWPTNRRRISSPYGRNRHPQLGTTTVNPGVDLEANQGDPVRSVAYGQITRIAFIRGFGNTIIISHGKGYYSVYARLGDITVGEGEIISTGQVIGEVGESAPEGGFHFEIWSARQSQDPLMWLKR
ncbi:MAG: M23 family metallopeptidase [Calditrichota bacterium]